MLVMPRFVILEHDHPQLHWDLMLERGTALWTWRLAQPPVLKNANIEAVPLGDHRLDYLHFEGPVSHNRGQVLRWDEGEYETLAAEGREAFRVHLQGKRLQGEVVMEPLAGGWVLRLDEAKKT